MTDPVKIALISGVSSTIAPTIVALVAVIRIKRVHRELNSRLTEWKNETTKSNALAVLDAYDRGKRAPKGKLDRRRN